MRFKDSPEPCDPAIVPPGKEEKVMHSSFRIGQSTIMASDCSCSGQPAFGGGISLSLSASDPDHARRLFDALAEGGQVHMLLTETFFSPSFGVLADRFGVNWMVVVPRE
jgi:PhnB protein